MRINETTMVESREVREKFMDRVGVLDKVKKLLTLPSMDCMTTKQVAEYYEVDYETVAMQVKRNYDEFELDGMRKIPVSEIKTLISTKCTDQKIVNRRGGFIVINDDGVEFSIPNAGINAFTRRAVLRMGMLLRDSAIAKEVRTQLLNTFENATDEQRTADINKEQALVSSVADAFSNGNISELMVAMKNLDDFRKRHIDALKQECTILSGKALQWSNRACLSKIVRTFAAKAEMSFPKVYKELYNEIYYKHGISLKARGDKPYAQWLKDNEFPKVYQTIAAMCEAYGIDVDSVFASAKMTMDDVNKMTSNIEGDSEF